MSLMEYLGMSVHLFPDDRQHYFIVVSCRNPIGRTGMTGRGLLGKWGPNHAADPIVTRWKKDSKGARVMVNGKPCLEFVAIKRRDTGEWALPGVRGGHYVGHHSTMVAAAGYGGGWGHSLDNTEERVWGGGNEQHGSHGCGKTRN